MPVSENLSRARKLIEELYLAHSNYFPSDKMQIEEFRDRFSYDHIAPLIDEFSSGQVIGYLISAQVEDEGESYYICALTCKVERKKLILRINQECPFNKNLTSTIFEGMRNKHDKILL
ncbi:MAG: hypothetical protein AABW65_02060 [Nanoarchaeota archaeon]